MFAIAFLPRRKCPITSWETEGGKGAAVTDIIFLGSKIAGDSDCSHAIKRRLILGKKAIAETSLCQQRSVWSKLWFFQQSSMDVRVGL